MKGFIGFLCLSLFACGVMVSINYVPKEKQAHELASKVHINDVFVATNDINYDVTAPIVLPCRHVASNTIEKARAVAKEARANGPPAQMISVYLKLTKPRIRADSYRVLNV